MLVTAQSVTDKLATAFATQFYKSLVSGAGLEKAFQEAQAIDRTRDTIHRGRRKKKQGGEEELSKWELISKKGAESSLDWNLPTAASKPLFGLPDIRSQNLPDNPFPHLKSFNQDYAPVFFGRGHDIRRLYNQITNTEGAPIILLYGQTGVGKSSLLNAGLIPRLKQKHRVFQSKRNPGLGLWPTLLSVMKTVNKPHNWWRALEERYETPCTCILDQVEGAFIEPLDNELKNFVKGVQAIMSDSSYRVAGKLVLSLRKDYMPEIEQLLQTYELAYRKVFLQSLDEVGIHEIIRGIVDNSELQSHYQLQVEEGLAEQVAHYLLDGQQGSLIAPTLQIFQANMWSRVRDLDPDQRIFTHKLYQTIKSEGIWMDDFLDKQLKQLSEIFRESGLALDLLGFHISEFATARQRSQEEILMTYEHVSLEIEMLLKELRSSYLLFWGDQRQSTALAHDILAPLILRRIKHSEAPGQRALRILESRKTSTKSPQIPLLLGEELRVVEKGRLGMRTLSIEEVKFLQKSRSNARKEWVIKRVFPITIIALLITGMGLGWSYRIERVRTSGLSKEVQSVREANEALFQAKDTDTPIWEAYDQAIHAYRTDSNQQTVYTLVELYQQAPFSRPVVLDSSSLPSKSIWSWTFDSLEQAYFFLDEEANRWGPVRLANGYTFSHITGIVASRDGKWIAAIVRKTDPVSGNKRSFITVWRPHIRMPYTLFEISPNVEELYASEDGKIIITKDYMNNLKGWQLWDKSTWQHPAEITQLSIAPSGKLYAVSAGDHAYLWNLNGKSPLLLPHRKKVSSVYFGGRDNELYTTSRDGSIKWWQHTNWELQHTELLSSRRSKPLIAADLAQGPQGDQWLIITEQSLPAKMYSIEQNAIITEFSDSRYIACACMYAGESIWAATIQQDDHRIRIWDGDGKLLNTSEALPADVFHIACSPGGHYVIVSSINGHAYLYHWSGKELRLQRTLQHRSSINRAHFSSDGSLIITASTDKTAKIWTSNGNYVLSLRYQTIVKDAIFSPDGKYVLAGLASGEVRMTPIHPEEIILQFYPPKFMLP